MNSKLILALVAACSVLCGARVYGQSTAINTNGVLSIQSSGTTTNSPVIEISPEVRLQLLQTAAEEIGHPEPNDLENLLARHSASQAKMMAIQSRQARTSTNTVEAALVSVRARPSADLSVPASSVLEQLDRAVAQLAEVRALLNQQQRENQNAK